MTRVRRESLFTVFPDLFKKIKERKGNGKERNRKEQQEYLITVFFTEKDGG